MRFRDMFYRMIWVTLLLCCLQVVSQVEARQIFPLEETWRYGSRPTPGEEAGEVVEDSYDLLAYRLDGEVVPVVEGLDGVPLLFDLSSDHLLAVDQEEGLPIYYEIEGIQATRIETSADSDTDDFAPYVLISYRVPYALLSSGLPGTQVIIIDLENHTVQMSDYPAFYRFDDCCVLTERGTLQYFARLEDERDPLFGLVERDLQSGEERVLFSDPNLLISGPNATGDRWLLAVTIPDARERTYILWQGEAEVSRETVELGRNIRWVGDVLYKDNFLCEPNCDIELRYPDGTVSTFPVVYLLKDRMFFTMSVQPDGSLIGQVRNPDQMLKIGADGSLRLYGDLNYREISTNVGSMLSPDGRFVAVSLDPSIVNFAVVDTETGERVITRDPEQRSTFVIIYYFPEGVLANSYGDAPVTQAQYYRSSDQQLFDLPAETIRYFEVVNDNTLLYFERSEQIDAEIGSYDLESGEMRPIVEGVSPLPTRPAAR